MESFGVYAGVVVLELVSLNLKSSLINGGPDSYQSICMLGKGMFYSS